MGIVSPTASRERQARLARLGEVDLNRDGAELRLIEVTEDET